MLLLIGVVLDYVLETQILLPNLSNELVNEAILFGEMTKSNQSIWENPASAKDYLHNLEPILDPFVMILDLQGRMLASTDPLDADQTGIEVESKERLEEAIESGASIETMYSRQLEADIVNVLVPARTSDGHIVGMIRMSYHLENVYKQFLSLRYAIIGILAFGVLIGVSIALLMAIKLGNSIHYITNSIQKLASGKEYTHPEEQGPEEIVLLYRSVKSLVERLRELENTRNKLLTNLVHEIGRPLGALLLAVQALQAGARQDEEMTKGLVAGMEKEIRILERLVNDLSGLHDQVLGTMELKTRPVILSEWLSNALQTHQEAAKSKGVRWHATISEELPTIDADPDRLAQAVGNLVNNAIKFTSPGGRVSIDAGIQDDEVRIQIHDTGPGIPLEEQHNVFSPFYRGPSEYRYPQGMGLGLSIAHDLVEAHHGRLEFSSKYGEGSVFTIYLPSNPSEK
jgi:signal transduction histidine kinase